jgi:hypothetical protein
LAENHNFVSTLPLLFTTIGFGWKMCYFRYFLCHSSSGKAVRKSLDFIGQNNNFRTTSPAKKECNFL